jgi:hypothetical protein
LPTYRVYGELNKVYYTDVSASEPVEAFDVANQRQTNDWSEVEDDYVIEVFDVVEMNEELGIPEDGQIL